MGCVVSRIDQEERVRVCKERKKLMKKLVGYRGEFANSQLAYLKALKNTGVTLRQFTESDSLDLENTSYGLTFPPSPPLPLPPPPPPPPSFSPDSRKASDKGKGKAGQEENTEHIEANAKSSSWTYLDVFEATSPLHHPNQSETIEHIEDNCAESKMEFEVEGQGEELVENTATSSLPERPQSGEIDSSMMSWCNKDAADVALVVRKNKKTLEGIIRELDDYFLKASASAKEIAVFTDINIGDNSVPWKLKENKNTTGNRSPSAKVFTALSWNWSSKSLQFARDAVRCVSSEPCKPGAHCMTLEKLYVAEQKLYKELKEEEINKLELEKKKRLLQKQDENHDWDKTEKIRSSVESLETDNTRLQHSISTLSSSILELIDDELYPQLIALTSGLMEMWKMMYKSHKVQNHISRQLNHLTESLSMDLITEFHHQATAQLEAEVSFWYHSFCKLIISQQEYVRTLYRWIQLTSCLANDHQQSRYSSAVCRLCEEWQLGFDKLPDKVASEAIKSILLAIQSIIQQQAEEHYQQKRSEKLEKRLQKEIISLIEMEERALGLNSTFSPKHPLLLKRTKVEALKKRVDLEKGKHLNSVQVCKTMILNNLKTSLPNAFQELMVFSKASTQVFEAILGHARPEVTCNASENSTD